MKDAIAANLGVDPDNLLLTVSAGSVHVKIFVPPEANVDLAVKDVASRGVGVPGLKVSRL